MLPAGGAGPGWGPRSGAAGSPSGERSRAGWLLRAGSPLPCSAEPGLVSGSCGFTGASGRRGSRCVAAVTGGSFFSAAGAQRAAAGPCGHRGGCRRGRVRGSGPLSRFPSGAGVSLPRSGFTAPHPAGQGLPRSGVGPGTADSPGRFQPQQRRLLTTSYWGKDRNTVFSCKMKQNFHCPCASALSRLSSERHSRFRGLMTGATGKMSACLGHVGGAALGGFRHAVLSLEPFSYKLPD